MQASNEMKIKAGSFTINSGDSSTIVKSDSGLRDMWGGSDVQYSEADSVSAKSLKSSGDLSVEGGMFFIDSADDALHSNGNLSISGGEFSVFSGDDGVHADFAAEISGGILRIEKCYEGIEG